MSEPSYVAHDDDLQTTNGASDPIVIVRESEKLVDQRIKLVNRVLTVLVVGAILIIGAYGLLFWLHSEVNDIANTVNSIRATQVSNTQNSSKGRALQCLILERDSGDTKLADLPTLCQDPAVKQYLTGSR